MHVLHLHSGNLYGGVETLLRTLARCRTDAPGLEMSAALCFEGRLARELRAEGVPVAGLSEVRLRRPDTVLRARRALSAVLEERRPDIIVAHQSWPLALFGSTVRHAGRPLVFWVHSSQSPLHWLDRMAWAARPDLVLCNSRFTRGTLPSQPAPAEVLYCPVVAPVAFSRDPAVRRSLDTSETHMVVVQVGRLEPFKGHGVILRALADMSSRQDCTYWIVGGAQRPFEQKYVDTLRRDAHRLGVAGQVRFAGQREDVQAVLGAADVLCQPNLHPEGFGLSVVEALYAGLPVAGSAIGGVAEIVDETCGRLTPPGDAGALAAALDALSQPSLRASLAANAPRRAEALCNPARQMRELERLLVRVAAPQTTVH